MKQKAKDQVNRTIQGQPTPQPDTPSQSSADSSRPGTPPSPSAPVAEMGDLYYFCQVTISDGPKALGVYFTRVFPTARTSISVAGYRFSQYLADKYNHVLTSDASCASTAQRLESLAAKKRADDIQYARNTAPGVPVVEEDWIFTDRPSDAEKQAYIKYTLSHEKIYPKGSGRKAAEDAAIMATPEYRAAVEKENRDARPVCENNEMMSSFYNCACVADVVKAERQRVGGTVARGSNALHPTTYDLESSADLRHCAQLHGMKNYSYKRALQSQQLTRPEAQKIRVATCTSAEFVKIYTAKPDLNMVVVNAMFTQALLGCSH